MTNATVTIIKNDSGRYFRVAKYQFKINNENTKQKGKRTIQSKKANNTK